MTDTVHPDSIVPAPHVAAIPPAPKQPAAPAAPVTPPAVPVEGAAPAAPATPVAPTEPPPVELAPPVAAAPTPPSDAVVEYTPTGDASLDVALMYVGQRGFGPDHPAMVAAAKGDFAELEKALAALGDKAKDHKPYLNLAKDAFGRKQAAEKTQREAAAKVVYEAAGGQEKWAAIQKWASENADESERASINAALKAGGIAARAVVSELATRYAVAAKTANPKSAVKPDASAAAPTKGALSPREYAMEVEKLSAQLGTRMEESPEYASLRARRAAYRP